MPFERTLAKSVTGEEADVHLALDDGEHLGGARVRVRRVEAARGDVEARHGDAQRVEPRQRAHVHQCHLGAERVGGVAGVLEAREGEVGRGYLRCVLAHQPVHEHGGGGVGDAEVLERARVVRESQRRRRHSCDKESKEELARPACHGCCLHKLLCLGLKCVLRTKQLEYVKIDVRAS